MGGPFGFLSRLFAQGGGYARLVERFPATGGPPVGALHGETVMFANTVAYKRCVILGATAEGFYLRPSPPLATKHPAAFIPWGEVKRVERTSLYWRSALRLVVGDPPIGEVTMFSPTYDALRRQAERTSQAG
jgi:hypothetical protein